MTKLVMFGMATLGSLAVALAQETVVLRDGTQFRGRITGASDDSISLRSRDGDMRSFNMNQIDVIRFDHEGDRRDNDRRDNDRRDNNYQPPSTAYMTLPAGTAIAVRTNESINTRDYKSDRSYLAQVDQDVLDPNGNVIIPRGSDARMVVRRVGDNDLALDLQSVSVNGRIYNVDSNDVVEGKSREGVGGNKRTAEFAGGGAVLGTLLGAIAGGGKGAAIGALAGGAAGVGTQVLTRGSEVHVPSESVLTFRLDNPMTLR